MINNEIEIELYLLANLGLIINLISKVVNLKYVTKRGLWDRLPKKDKVLSGKDFDFDFFHFYNYFHKINIFIEYNKRSRAKLTSKI